MKSSTQVFLHIGTNKTGSTAIQHFFTEQREELKNVGLLYPATGCWGQGHFFLSTALGFHGMTPEKAAQIQQTQANASVLQEQLRQEIKDSAAQYVLLSSENFTKQRKIVPVKEFFSDYNTKIIVYLRRHDDWWESAYNQAVKTYVSPQWGQGFMAYRNFILKTAPKYGDYRHLVDRWAKQFGKKNIIVRPYETGQNQPDIATDMLRTIGLESTAQNMPPAPRRNESLSPLALNLVDTYQRARITPKMRTRLIGHALSLPKGESSCSLLSPQLRRQLIAENEEDYSYIAKHYLGREDGQLFYEPLPNELDTTWQDPMTTSSTTEIVEETIKALMKKIDVPEKK